MTRTGTHNLLWMFTTELGVMLAMLTVVAQIEMAITGQTA
jgi:hypothetical protein